jgi:ribonuclease HII
MSKAKKQNQGKKKSSKRKCSRGQALFEYDQSLGVRFIAGADEAGRGSLAGPLVAAAVLFDYEQIGKREMRELHALTDSKQHTRGRRERLYPLVLRTAVKVAIVTRCARGIDQRGLHVTNLAALRAALSQVASEDSLCLSDGFRLKNVTFNHQAVIGGDGRSAAIAAASIIAKVTRDRYMWRADELHPGWEFAHNVGYGTPTHSEAIIKLGISPLHRRSFKAAAYQQLSFTNSAEEFAEPIEGEYVVPGNSV